MIAVYETFKTREEAEAFMASYYRRYHPCGYSTSLSVLPCADGLFAVSGWRAASCD